MKKIVSFFAAAALVATMMTTSSCTKTCDAGYEGSDCKTETRAKFLGSYTGAEQCTVGTDNYTVTITSSSTDVVKVVYSNLYNQNFTVTGTVSGTTLTIASQTVGAAGTTVSGTGTLTTSGNTTTLALTYTLTPTTGAANTCTYTGVKN